MKDLREQLASRIRRISFGSTTVLSVLLLFIIFFINYEGCGIRKVDNVAKEANGEEYIDAEHLRKSIVFLLISIRRANNSFISR